MRCRPTPTLRLAPSQSPRLAEPEGSGDRPLPDPFDDADALGELEHEICTLAAHITAATHRLLVLVADFDRREGWRLGGHRSCAHWLHANTGTDLGTAREKVRVARALGALPRISEAMARGTLGFSAVRALSRVATPECEEELLEGARCSTTAALERFVRAWRTVSRADERALERERWRSRRLSVFPDDGGGMYVVRGRLPAEVGAVLMRAVEAASDALFREQAREETTPKQRRADALGLLAERALAAGFGGAGEDLRARAPEGTHDASAETADPDPHPDARNHVPAETSDPPPHPGARNHGSAETSLPPLSGTRAERYQVMLHVDVRTLRSGGGKEVPASRGGGASTGQGGVDGDAPGPGRSHLADGTRLAAPTARRLACDASVVTVTRGADGGVLDVGRRSRTVPPALRRALEVRDRGCVFPGCGLRFTEAHHLTHWAEGGPTALDNLVLLCRYHHGLVHEGGWELHPGGRGGDRHPLFVDPRGGFHAEPGPRRPAELGEGPAEALLAAHRALGLEPDGWRLGPRYAPEPERRALQARALEVLDQAGFGG